MKHPTIGTLGTNLLLYPSTIQNAGRLQKIARSLQQEVPFRQTMIVGIKTPETSSVEDLEPDLKIVRIPGSEINALFGGVRLMTLWIIRVYRTFHNKDLSAVAAHNVYLLPLAYWLSKKSGAIFVYNAHELETETIAATGIKKRIVKSIERRYIRRADIVSVVNDSIADWYLNEYPGIRKPVVVTNTPIDTGQSVDLHRLFSIPVDELIYIHVGFITKGRNIPLIMKEFAANPQKHVVFLGEGPLRSDVEDAGRAYPNIHWHPPVKPDQVVSYVRGADVSLCLIESSSLSYKLSTPNKLMEALVAGVPPLCSNLVEAKRLLGPERTSTWVLDLPSTQLGAALREITSDDITVFKTGWRALPSWDQQVLDLIRAYKLALITSNNE